MSTLQSPRCSALPSAEERNVRGAVVVVVAEAELETLAASAVVAVELLLRTLRWNQTLFDTDVAAADAAAVYGLTG